MNDDVGATSLLLLGGIFALAFLAGMAGHIPAPAKKAAPLPPQLPHRRRGRSNEVP